MRRSRFVSTLLALVLLGLGNPPAPAGATGVTVLPSALEPAGTGGLAALDRALAKLATSERLLVIAAHPDDEDTSLLALESLGRGGEAAYLALSRGDGGQNLIGPELGVGLGLLRTQELLSARRLDGAHQYFSRAYDFGYTRSLDETLRLWPREALLEDVVRILWRLRPQVVMSVFGDDGSGGHGQHQAAGWVAHEAFARAGDGASFPQLVAEGLLPWRPTTLYRGAWFAPEKATLKLPLAGIEPFAGHSYLQLAMASRSQHRSQDMGRLLELGPRDDMLTWVAGGGGVEGKDLFAGVDTRLAALVAGVPDEAALEATLAGVERVAREARARLRPEAVGGVAPNLAAMVRDLGAVVAQLRACSAAVCASAAELVEEKRTVAEQGLAIASGLALEAASDRETVVPGESLKVTVSLWNSGAQPIAVTALRLASAAGWSLPEPAGVARTLSPGELGKWEVAVVVPADARPTLPYFLARPLAGALYDWREAPAAARGEPFGPPVLTAELELAAGGTPFRLRREVVFRFADQARGELRRPLRVVPELEIDLDPDLVLLPQPGARARDVEVRLRSNVDRPLAGVLVDDGSTCAALRQPPRAFSLTPRGSAVLLARAVPCDGAASATLQLAARVGERMFRQSLPLVDYPHVPATPWPHAATAAIARFDLALPKLRRVGYVLGAADRVPPYLREVGVPVELLDGAALRAGDLSRFDAIVVGPRAYESEPALPAANPRLLDYLRGGGLLLVQYQQYPFVEGHFAPLPFAIARPHGRITDETAPVVALDPAHPVFHVPNEIGAADWQGWVQERGLYFAQTWDPGYTPLLAATDPGEPEQRGGLLVANIGKGTYVYTGLAFFRQLPAGVAGAYRLFANLLALGETRAPAAGTRVR